MTFTPEIEFQDRKTIKKFQEQKLNELLNYLARNSKYYQNIFANNKINIDKIKTLEDLQNIPITTKEDLQKYNDDFFCVPKSQIADYMTTSGTLSDPTVFAASSKDLERLAYNEAISFVCAGINLEMFFN